MNAVLADPDGRAQWLVGAWSALRRAAGAAVGASARGLLAGLERAEVRAAPDGPPVWADCDTPADLKSARVRAARG